MNTTRLLRIPYSSRQLPTSTLPLLPLGALLRLSTMTLLGSLEIGWQLVILSTE